MPEFNRFLPSTTPGERLAWGRVRAGGDQAPASRDLLDHREGGLAARGLDGELVAGGASEEAEVGGVDLAVHGETAYETLGARVVTEVK